MTDRVEMPLAEEYYQHALDDRLWSTPAARAAWKQEAAAAIKPLAERKVSDYHDFIDRLTPEQIAQLDAMTKETDRQDDYDIRSEGGWM